MRLDGGFLNFGMRITASGDDSSVRFGCLGVLVYPKQPDPGYGEAVCQSVGGSISFFSVSNGVLTFYSRRLRAIPAF
jgi:hypothetical protein